MLYLLVWLGVFGITHYLTKQLTRNINTRFYNICAKLSCLIVMDWYAVNYTHFIPLCCYWYINDYRLFMDGVDNIKAMIQPSDNDAVEDTTSIATKSMTTSLKLFSSLILLKILIRYRYFVLVPTYGLLKQYLICRTDTYLILSIYFKALCLNDYISINIRIWV